MIKNKCNVPGIEKKSGEDLMENMIKIADSQRGLLWILFAVLVIAAFFWNLYRRERKKILKVDQYGSQCICNLIMKSTISLAALVIMVLVFLKIYLIGGYAYLQIQK